MPTTHHQHNYIHTVAGAAANVAYLEGVHKREETVLTQLQPAGRQGID